MLTQNLAGKSKFEVDLQGASDDFSILELIASNQEKEMGGSCIENETQNVKTISMLEK